MIFSFKREEAVGLVFQYVLSRGWVLSSSALTRTGKIRVQLVCFEWSNEFTIIQAIWIHDYKEIFSVTDAL